LENVRLRESERSKVKWEEKYLMLERTDLEATLMPYERNALQRIVKRVREYRTDHGKPENTYVVINEDELYFPAVLKLIEEAEQAALKAEEIARRRSQGARDGWEIRRARQSNARKGEGDV
jgi:hypothetical protein